MVTSNFAIYGTKILYEVVRDILFFPLWWYSRGLFQLVLFLKDFLLNREQALAWSVWAKNIFTPMYGQQDFAGKAISFVVRLIQIAARSVFMLFWLAVAVAGFLFWLFLPVAVLAGIIFQVV